MNRLFVKMIVFLILTYLSIPSYGAEQKADAKTALTCTTKCPYFLDVYDGDPAFKKSFLTALKSAKISKPRRWIDGEGVVDAPMKPTYVGGKTYLEGSVCEPHNCSHNIVFLYLESQKRTVGKYTPDNGYPIWFGNPNESERKKLSEIR